MNRHLQRREGTDDLSPVPAGTAVQRQGSVSVLLLVQLVHFPLQSGVAPEHVMRYTMWIAQVAP